MIRTTVACVAVVSVALLACKDEKPPTPSKRVEPAKVATPEKTESRPPAEGMPELQRALKDREPYAAGTECVISRPDKPGSYVTLYRTYDEEADWDIATAKGDDARVRVFASNTKDPVSIANGTACSVVDMGSATSKVRITEGPHRGKVLWALTQWTSRGGGE